ncbi:hypothetical protein Glove_335g29 [Diversispora epigaea]|uniref:Uncharacterized protein n=1 Tax=Diversispora epigaea TaxID=1348612 RepID=A0A397HHX3_9GLOM|nr:hypothetical protein Glove_335g29 [Diversispora epigaea]
MFRRAEIDVFGHPVPYHEGIGPCSTDLFPFSYSVKLHHLSSIISIIPDRLNLRIFLFPSTNYIELIELATDKSRIRTT